jgi:hypothetical protein
MLVESAGRTVNLVNGGNGKIPFLQTTPRCSPE